MKKIILPGIIAGAAMLLAGMILNQIFGFLYPSLVIEYTNTFLFRPWSDPAMSLYFLHPFILGVILSWAWDKTKKIFTGETLFERAKKFGLFYWLVVTIPGMFITYSSFQVSLIMVLAWTVSGLIDVVIAGLVFAKMSK